jgi:teichuronic acid biosynthesis glycosyltransferase TuaG
MLFSIIIPCYNAEKFIADALDSALDQSLSDYEILACDDCSTDTTFKILKDYERKFPKKVRIYQNIENKGVGYTRDKLLKAAKGRYLAFLDADDLWEEGKLDRCRELMAHTHPDIIFHGLYLIDEHSNRLGHMKLFRNFKRHHIFIRNPFPTSGSIVSTKLLYAKEMPKIRKRQDYAYWLRILKNNRNVKVVKIPETLGSYRKRKESLSSNKVKNVRYNYKVFRISGYSSLVSCLFVIINICEWVFRRIY